MTAVSQHHVILTLYHTTTDIVVAADSHAPNTAENS